MRWLCAYVELIEQRFQNDGAVFLIEAPFFRREFCQACGEGGDDECGAVLMVFGRLQSLLRRLCH